MRLDLNKGALKEQHRILQGYISEYIKVYNLCVNIWKLYPTMTSEWTIIKDVIYDFFYRYNNGSPISLIESNIVNKLKEIQEIYNIEREIIKKNNEEFIMKEKKRISDEFKENMKKYKEALKETRKTGINIEVKKPKREKLIVPKVKKEPKQRRENFKKPAPDDLLKSAIFEFCTNLKENNKRKFDDNAFTFEMTYKDTHKFVTIELDKRSLSEKGIYIRSMKELKCKQYKKIFMEYVLNKGLVNFPENCKLTYDTKMKKYYFIVVFKKERKVLTERKPIVAVDPGEKIFQAYYSPEEYGNIGDNSRIKILRIKKKIQKLQSILDKNKNKKGKTIRNKKSIIIKIQKLYNNIKGYVNEIHKKSAKYLCENYERILIPEFKTKPMLSNKKRKAEYERIHKIENKEEAKRELKELNKKVQLSGDVKFVLQNLRHYTFRKFLEAKAEEFGTIVYVINEQFTSQTCINCGKLSKEYNNRIKTCPYCGYVINRDIGGSRNIFCKTLVQLPINIPENLIFSQFFRNM